MQGVGWKEVCDGGFLVPRHEFVENVTTMSDTTIRVKLDEMAHRVFSPSGHGLGAHVRDDLALTLMCLGLICLITH